MVYRRYGAVKKRKDDRRVAAIVVLVSVDGKRDRRKGRGFTLIIGAFYYRSAQSGVIFLIG